jgi:hypothetical protein
MEMRYFWLLDGKTQQYFKFYYQPSQENMGNYPFKHHTEDIHKHVQSYYVHTDKSPALPPRALKPTWGTHMPRSPHYNLLGSPLVCLSPQAFLATKYWASLAYSIGYHLLTSILEEYH